MSLDEYKNNMNRCIRCSLCKLVPTPQIRSWEFSGGCPSIQYGKFHAYSGGGKVLLACGLLEGLVDYTDEMLDIIKTCSMCGACDISCKLNYQDNVEPIEVLRELRTKVVEDGQMDPVYMYCVENLKKEDNIFGNPKADRANWSKGLGIKDILEEKADVYLHVGCNLSYDEELWPVIRGAASILQGAGVDFGIAKKEEACCGGRVFDMGFRGECSNFAESMIGRVKASGAKTLLTCCSDCYGTFKQVHPKIGQPFGDIEIVHITEYLERLITQGDISFTRDVPLKVTYHDPCHLGRLGETYTPWNGTREYVLNKMIVSNPVKEVRFGVNGVYDAPRNILGNIPGLELLEMDRIREYSYCCGAGGGAREACEEFSMFAATERLKEAKSTGADVIVTACPWCERNFKDAVQEKGLEIEVYDIIELIVKGMGK